MRKTLKILHTLSASGLIGGLACHMILLAYAPQADAAAYADMRVTIAAISDYVLMPSMAIALVSGLLSIAIHRPFHDRGWVWLKAASGILVFKGVLTVVAEAGNISGVAARAANGEDVSRLLETSIAHEWGLLIVVMALSVANVILGIWRPLQLAFWRAKARPVRPPAKHEPVTVAESGRQTGKIDIPAE